MRYLLPCLLMLSTLAFGQANRFTDAIKSRVQVINKEAEKKVDVLIDGKLFTSYLYGGGDLKKPVLYPIMSPKGNFITRGWPIAPRPGERVDHPHHIGMWFSYGDVNGVDFWNNSNAISPEHKGPFGTIRHKAIKRAQGGSAVGTLETESDWVGPDGKVIMTETTVFKFSGMGNDRIIDRTTTLKAGLLDVSLKDNKEGLLGLRLNRQLEMPTKEPAPMTDATGKPGPAVANNTGVSGMYINSEDQHGDSVWGKRAEWCMLQGTVNGEPISLAFLDHPKNLGHPAYWHARGYGLFAINPFGQAVFSNGLEELNARIPAGSALTLKHQLRIQSGRQLQEADCERLFTQFGEPEED